MALRVHRTFTTTASPEATFAFLADFRTTTAWDPGTVSCELASGTAGTVGATYRNVSEFLGRETELTYVAEQIEPQRLVHFVGRAESFRGVDHLEFTPDGTGTRVEYRAEFAFSGLARLGVPVVAAYLPFLASKTITQLRETLDAL